ncbi:MAG: DUF6259 domain-containing protein [Spirochaetales bacterium]|nr:DUF6259 domain-containing protein [Spirochaetales bacterium]
MSSESVIYHSDDLLCRLHIDGAMEVTRSGPLYVFRILSGAQVCMMKLEAEINNPDSCWYWWPNHEGERGLLSQVHEGLESLENRTRGISVVYPVSASCRTIILGDEKAGIILSAMPDEKGRISQITVKSKNAGRVEFQVKTGRSCWILTQYQGNREDALQWITKIIDKVKWPSLEKAEPCGNFLLQVGLIGPDYDCMVPVEKGFLVLKDIAGVMKKHLGKGNWLHVFGYAHGHDILYPDYKPSGFMGGTERLKEAIREVHKKGQKVSFYLNLRIADQSLVENDFSLQKSVFLDSLGKKVEERNHERDFYVMNPDCEGWQDRIVEEARRLVDLGADGLELNYRGRRALMVPLGEQWGDGIRKIMTRIKDMGVKVWYRGGTDIYPADWLEMSREDLVMEDDGHLYSGCVLGEFDPRLYMTMVPGRQYLLPLSRTDVPVLDDAPVMRDLENIMGGLFIYNEEYMERIEMILQRAAEEYAQQEEEAVKKELSTANAVVDELEESIPSMDMNEQS